MLTRHRVTVVLADDSEPYRRGIEQALRACDDLRVVAVAADGDEALDAIVSLDPDVALLDLRMPHRDGIDVALAADARTRVVLMSSALDEEAERRARAAGIAVCVSKDETRGAICEHVRRVALAR